MPHPTSIAPSYEGSGVAIRRDLRESHAQILDTIRSPGSWLTGAERRALAEESRAALACGLCRARKEALSPEHATGTHDAVTDLPEALVDLAHRVRTDSGRLTRSGFEKTLASGVAVEVYVEAVGIIAFVAGVDAFCRALGTPPFTLPDPLPGEPDRHRPAGTRSDVAWVPMLLPEDASGPEADLYPNLPMVPNIAKALSLVPAHARLLQAWTASHYVDLKHLSNPTVGRDLDRLQIELVASRVSAINECFY